MPESLDQYQPVSLNWPLCDSGKIKHRAHIIEGLELSIDGLNLSLYRRNERYLNRKKTLR